MRVPILPEGTWHSASPLIASLLIVASPAVTQAQQTSAALAEVRASAHKLGLSPFDVASLRVSDAYVDQRTGRSYVYLQQTYQGTDVRNAMITVVVSPDGEATIASSSFAADPASALRSDDLEVAARPSFGWFLPEDHASTNPDGPPSTEELAPAGQLVGKTLGIQTPDSYNVIPIPAESPLHPFGSGTPQSVEVDPADVSASPFGWHDTDGLAGADLLTTQGNNVSATKAGAPAASATLDFNFALNLAADPTTGTNPEAAIVNVFYWLNVLHDILNGYGFDEAAGNFQELNYGGDGIGSDGIDAWIQAAGNCNANASETIDGVAPQVNMYTCNVATPSRDGALDNGVLAHLMMTSAAARLVGGPGTASCLNATESSAFRIGLSDWFGLWATQQSADTREMARGIGTYLIGEPANGAGVRSVRYSTDFLVNDLTYGDIATQPVPHGVGMVLATILWDLNWALIGDLPGIPQGDDGAGGGFGYSNDKYATGSGGNNLALQLLIDALKIVPCNPGFVDLRNALLSADQALTGGANECAIWKTFARRGLGFSADQGSSGSAIDQTEAFDVPAVLDCKVPVAGQVLLEGAYTNSGMMSSTLNPSIPFLNPFGGAPWNYGGGESASTIPPTAVDWVLLRSRYLDSGWVDADTVAAFVHTDGSLTDATGTGLPRLGVGGRDSVYIAVAHRNHLEVMTRLQVASGDPLTFNLTTANSAFGSNPMKDLTGGYFGMFACDANADGQVTAPDFNLWIAATTAGATGYEQADCNLDAQVTAPDFNLWIANTTAGASSKVPD